MDPILLKFRGKFIEESVTLLDQLEKDLLELEKRPDDKELIESAFRAMHTIKGISGMYGFDCIAEFTHQMESLFMAIRDHIMGFSREIFDISFLSIDHIRRLLTDENLIDPDNKLTNEKLLKSICSILTDANSISCNALTNKGIEPNTSTPSSWHILLKADEQIYFRGISLMNIFSDLANIGRFEISRLSYQSDKEIDTWSIVLYTDAAETDIKEVFMFIEDNCIFTRLTNQNLFETQNCIETLNELSILDFIESKEGAINEIIIDDNEINSTKNIITEAKANLVKRIPVDSAKLDNLMYLVSELITLNSRFTLATRDEKYEALLPFTERLDNLSKLFRNNALEIRLVPLSETVLRFKRLIRDLSKQLHKKVELITDGVDTELDKTTLDQLNDPLMHIIRNCIDHGIELPADRLSKGKKEIGTIRISASHSGNYVMIRVEDDGGGIDTNKIRAKAIEKKLIGINDQLTKEELVQLIFLPGFSTNENITEVSGRGVGMDVVKRKITDLRGEVSINSEFGIGTTFILKLQQSVTIIDTLLFKVEDTYFTIPVSDVDVCLQVNKTFITQRQHTGTIPYTSQLIPYLSLRETFALEGSYTDKIKAIIIKNNDKQIALLTDEIIGEHQAVLKPLGKLFKNEKSISAASQLGDGKLAFMLDTNELFAKLLK